MARPEPNELRRNFFQPVSFETIFARADVAVRHAEERQGSFHPGGVTFKSGSTTLRVFILGGTGSIGSPIVRELIERGHEVWALARSEASASKLREGGATVMAGDIAAPERWTTRLPLIRAL